MKILILSFFLVLCSLLYSQGNLQFNQVLSPSISTTTLYNGGSVKITLEVPSGKVWKIENASFSRTGETIYGTDYRLPLIGSNTAMSFYLDDYVVCNFGVGGTGAVVTPNFPIWLSQGSHSLMIVNHSTSNSTSPARGTLSVIEFNIIP